MYAYIGVDCLTSHILIIPYTVDGGFLKPTHTHKHLRTEEGNYNEN